MPHFRIQITGQEPLIIKLDENEAIDLHIQNHAAKFLKPEMPKSSFQASGMRWLGDDFFNFHWGSSELKLNDSISIQIVESSEATTAVLHEEKYIEPEKECSFCYRKASEVRHMIEGSMFARICDECIGECQQLVQGRSEI